MREIKDALRECGFRFNKQFGQNFITDKNLLSAIVLDSGISSQDDVLEIGPGAGSLTQFLTHVARRVVAYEIDRNLKQVLELTLDGLENVEVVFADALKSDITEIESHFEGKYSIVANLPYYITSPLIFKFLEESKRVKSITIMVQKEVAERIVSKPRSADYGAMTVMINSLCETEILRIVKRTNFFPQPNVDSALIKLDVKQNRDGVEEIKFKEIVKCAFSMRRKTLVNNLTKGELKLDTKLVLNALRSLGLDERIRAEELDYLTFEKLSCLL